MIQNENYIDAAYIKNLQKAWAATDVKSKMLSKILKRRDFDGLSFLKRHEFLKNGGKITD